MPHCEGISTKAKGDDAGLSNLRHAHLFSDFRPARAWLAPGLIERQRALIEEPGRALGFFRSHEGLFEKDLLRVCE